MSDRAFYILVGLGIGYFVFRRVQLLPTLGAQQPAQAPPIGQQIVDAIGGILNGITAAAGGRDGQWKNPHNDPSAPAAPSDRIVVFN